MVRRDMVGCDMVMTSSAAAMAVTGASYGWDDVVDEIRSSCVRRAGAGQLLDAAGVVGVLAGAAPVAWVHGPTDVEALVATLQGSPEVGEVYVTAGQQAAVTGLGLAGWSVDQTVSQMVHGGRAVLQTVSGLPAVQPLQPADMTDVRELMRRHAGIDEAMLAHSYGDDFFTVAAPVWMYGARDGAGQLVGLIAVRRQGRAAMGFALTVDPDWRSTGLSTALVAAAVRQAMSVGAEFVHAQAGDRSVRRLSDCGFVPVGQWVRLVRA